MSQKIEKMDSKKVFIIFFLPTVIASLCDELLSTPPPAIRQIEDDSVFVNWVDAAQNEEIVAIRLKHWITHDPESGFEVDIRDMNINFEFVSVKKGETYSFQLMVQTSGKKRNLYFTLSRTKKKKKIEKVLKHYRHIFFYI